MLVSMPATVRVGAGPDGALTYLVAMPPEALPPVRRRDLAASWDAAREAAAAQVWGISRSFRFRREDGGITDIALDDADARCWAEAVDATLGMDNAYGVSLCLRLLALVDLLSRASWTRGMYALGHDGTEFHPALLDAAANAPLDRDARFDDHGLRARLARPLPATPRPARSQPARSSPAGAFA